MDTKPSATPSGIGRSGLAITAALLVIGLAALLIWFRSGREVGDTEPSESVGVRQRIEILFDAAQKSDVERYLDCLAEPLRSKVKAQLGARPDSLGSSEAKLKGLTFPADVDRAEGDEATVVVEKIYSETIERVRIRLVRDDGEWRIAEITPLDRIAPDTNYGTPVVPRKRPSR